MSDFLTRLAQRGAGLRTSVGVSPTEHRTGADARRSGLEPPTGDTLAETTVETTADMRPGSPTVPGTSARTWLDERRAGRPEASAPARATGEPTGEATSAGTTGAPHPSFQALPPLGARAGADRADSVAPRSTAAQSIDPDLPRRADPSRTVQSVGPSGTAAGEHAATDVAAPLGTRAQTDVPPRDVHPDEARRSASREIADVVDMRHDSRASRSGDLRPGRERLTDAAEDREHAAEPRRTRDSLMAPASPAGLQPVPVRALQGVAVEREPDGERVEVHIGRIEVKVAAPPAPPRAPERLDAGFERYRRVRRHTDRNWY